jgi:CBS domain-containing protein
MDNTRRAVQQPGPAADRARPQIHWRADCRHAIIFGRSSHDEGVMQIRDIFSGRKIKDIAGADQTQVVTVSRKTKLADATRTLSEKKIGILVVCDDKGELLGVLSERDVVRAVAAHGNDSVGMSVDAFMTKKVETCSLSDPPHRVIRRMSFGNFRHMPVMEGDELKGVISSKDIVKYYVESAKPEQLAHLLKGFSWV